MSIPTLSWLWKAGEGVNGLKINAERGLLEWYDEVGCACGDSTQTQTYTDFAQRGPKFDDIPEDVLAEVRESVQKLS